MQTQVVEKLPPCAACTGEDRPEPKDAIFRVLTPMKQKLAICEEHWLEYVETRLGSGTVAQLVVAQKTGGKTRAAA